MDEASAGNLAGGEEVELGLGDSLGEVLLGDTTSSDGLETLDSLNGDLADGGTLAGDLDGEETSIGVGVVVSKGLGAGVGSGGLGEEAETGGPLDVGNTAEETDKDGSLGVGDAKGSTGEGNDDGVLAVLGNALLTTKVLGGGSVQVAGAGGGNTLEEGLNPLLETGLAGAIGDNGDVGLVVGEVGEGGDRVLVEVGRGRGVDGRVEGGTEAAVESDVVGGIEGDGGRVELGLLLVDAVLDELVELVGYGAARQQQVSTTAISGGKVLSRTGVLGLRDDLGKELGEVGEVLAEEGGLEDDGLAGVVGLQLAAEELGLAGDAEGGSLVGVLCTSPRCANY